jgi:flagellar biosynthesis GTPase FlhF
MSRGPGRWQQAILDELQRREVFYVREVLPATHTRSDQLAVIRAAHRLASQGLIVVDVERQHWKRTAWGAVVVARPGVVIDRLTLAASYRLRDELSDSGSDNDLLPLSRSSPELLAAYRKSEAAERAWKVARRQAKAARQAAAQVRVEALVAERVQEALRAHAERELQEKRRRQAAQEGAALRQLAETAAREQLTANRRSLASLVKFLRLKGEAVTEASIIAQAQAVLRWSQAAAEEALAMLKASGDYQRIVEAPVDNS